MARVAGDVLVIYTFLASLGFCTMYHLLSRWWETPFGRSLMTYQIAITSVLGLSLPRIFWGSDHVAFQVLRLVVFTVVPIALTWRLVVLIRLQRSRGKDDS